QHSPGYLPTPRPGTTVRPESKSRIRILQASRRPGSIRDAQREPAEEGTGAYRKMQASIILQGRSVHRARQVLPIEVRRSTEGASASLFLSCTSRSRLPVRPPFAVVSFRPRRGRAYTRPTDRSLRPFRFFPLSSSPLPSPLPPLVLTSGRDRKKSRATSRAALRVYRKKGRNRADRRCSGLCLKTNEHRTARSSSRNKEYANARRRENDGARERETEKERGGRQHRVTSAEPIFGSAKCKQNDRPVMHRGVWRKSSNPREQGGPIYGDILRPCIIMLLLWKYSRDEGKEGRREEARAWYVPREKECPIFCEAPMHDEERHGDGDGSAIQLEGDNEGDRRSSATKRDLFYK
ncbi:hypothetical protein ALC57_13072, partial [Trachymyrmex cornetzi]